MPSAVVVSVSPVTAAAAARGTPKKLMRGRTRTILRHTIAKLQAILNADLRESRRAAALGYVPVLILGKSGTKVNNAYGTILGQLNFLMTAKVGDV